MRVIVYTALIGDGAPPLRTLDARRVVLTDHAGPPLAPRRAARQLKMTPETLFPEAEVTIWMDATFDLLVDPIVLVDAAAATGAPVVGFAHPDRRRMTEEAAEVTRLGLAPAADVARQVADYHAAGFDTDTVPQSLLTTTGLLIRWHTPAVAAFNRFWAAQIAQYTLRDQLSIDYCAWTLGLRIGHLRGHYRANAFARYDRSRCIGRVA